jgi:class 3 adenylate cyclase
MGWSSATLACLRSAVSSSVSGIHFGDVVEESEGNLMGDGVNIAARLEGVADPGGICLSEDACRQVRDRLTERFSDLGEKDLKNTARRGTHLTFPDCAIAEPWSKGSSRLPEEENVM